MTETELLRKDHFDRTVDIVGLWEYRIHSSEQQLTTAELQVWHCHFQAWIGSEVGSCVSSNLHTFLMNLFQVKILLVSQETTFSQCFKFNPIMVSILV